MKSDPATGQQREPMGPASQPGTQTARMRAAIDQAVATAPAFLRGEVDADHMAHTMVRAVRQYAEQERPSGDGTGSAEADALQRVLAELMACGSGYLAGRCDAACVARTMTYMVREFG